MDSVPSSVSFVLLVELALIVVTTFLMIKPAFLYRGLSAQFQAMFKWGGMLFLCLTFCWSVIVGIILSMNELSIRI